MFVMFLNVGANSFARPYASPFQGLREKLFHSIFSHLHFLLRF